MNPSSENSIVRASAIDTLNEMVNSMLFLVDSIPSIVERSEDDEQLVYLNANKFDGFKNTLDGIRAATEIAFTQHSSELRELKQQTETSN